MEIWVAVAVTAAVIVWLFSVVLYAVLGLMFSFRGSVASAVGCAVSATLFTLAWLAGATSWVMLGTGVAAASALSFALTAAGNYDPTQRSTPR